jgi:peptidyl-tRNA hydrolase, PTH1 family
MRVIAGLGNPGPEYAETRHNVGFRVVELLAGNLGAKLGEATCSARWGVTDFGDDEDVALAMPQTFMNVCGKSVRCVLTSLNVGPADLVVVHDDLDLPLGAVRVKDGGGAGGHNGVASVIEALSSDVFTRVRLGIGRPPGKMDPADFVLEQFRAEELEEVEYMIPSAGQAVAHILEHGVASAMNEYNTRGD